MSDPLSMARPTTGWQMKMNRMRGWWHWNVSRRLPRLVWPGDEVDVLVTFREARLPEAAPMPLEQLGDFAFSALREGRLPKIEADLEEIGITFDTGVGREGRDWEWDYSLSGPISVKFKRRAAKPERRR